MSRKNLPKLKYQILCCIDNKNLTLTKRSRITVDIHMQASIMKYRSISFFFVRELGGVSKQLPPFLGAGAQKQTTTETVFAINCKAFFFNPLNNRLYSKNVFMLFPPPVLSFNAASLY
jgi:hypothetical protein